MNFGSLPEGLHAKADAGMMDKVISNLLENAAKYSNPRSPITISTEANDHKVSLSIADRGAGIDPAEQGLIFERFYRARSQVWNLVRKWVSRPAAQLSMLTVGRLLSPGSPATDLYSQ